MATMYKGGFLVPILMGTFITTIVFQSNDSLRLENQKEQEILKASFNESVP